MSDVRERIGQYDVSVRCAPPPSSESPPTQNQRSEALTAWLLARWHAEQKESEHGDAESAA